MIGLAQCTNGHSWRANALATISSTYEPRECPRCGGGVVTFYVPRFKTIPKFSEITDVEASWTIAEEFADVEMERFMGEQEE